MFYVEVCKKGKPYRHYKNLKSRSWGGLKRLLEKEMKKPDSLKWGFLERLHQGKTSLQLTWHRNLKHFPEKPPFPPFTTSAG